MTYAYHLAAAMGTIHLPIVLNVGGQFEHESGLYRVDEIKEGVFMCGRVDSSQHLTNEINKGRTFKYNT